MREHQAPQIYLLGDSIFDNERYLDNGQLSVAAQIHKKYRYIWQYNGNNSRNWRNQPSVIDHGSEDGTTAETFANKEPEIKIKKTNYYFSLSEPQPRMRMFFLSLGMNDILHFMREIKTLDLFQKYNPGEILFERKMDFEKAYEKIMQTIIHYSYWIPSICTIYDGVVEDRSLFSIIQSMFNDVIYKIGYRHSVPVIELRQIFTDQDDYTNFVEPSEKGGEKLAGKISAEAEEVFLLNKLTKLWSAEI